MFRHLSMMMWTAGLGLTMLATACSGEDEPGTTQPGMTACGIEAEDPAQVGTECMGLSGCGRGMQNFFKDPTCDSCAHRADSHVCEAGTCREMAPTEQFSLRLEGADSIAGAASFTVAVLNPIAADGSKVTCAQLLTASCDLENNPALNFTNSTHKRFNPPVSAGMIYDSGISGEPGPDRILLLRATTEMSGGGQVLGQVCKEGITVPQAERLVILGTEWVAP